MSRTIHLILQGLVAFGQVFVSFPDVELTPNWRAFAHAALAGLTLVIAHRAQEFNTDGTRQTEPYGPKSENRDE